MGCVLPTSKISKRQRLWNRFSKRSKLDHVYQIRAGVYLQLVLCKKREYMKATITVLPGDGIGPEVINQSVAVLSKIASKYNHDFTFNEALIGGIAIDQTGTSLPPETLATAEQSDAVLLGAVGGPKWDNPSAAVRPEQGL